MFTIGLKCLVSLENLTLKNMEIVYKNMDHRVETVNKLHRGNVFLGIAYLEEVTSFNDASPVFGLEIELILARQAFSELYLWTKMASSDKCLVLWFIAITSTPIVLLPLRLGQLPFSFCSCK